MALGSQRHGRRTARTPSLTMAGPDPAIQLPRVGAAKKRRPCLNVGPAIHPARGHGL